MTVGLTLDHCATPAFAHQPLDAKIHMAADRPAIAQRIIASYAGIGCP